MKKVNFIFKRCLFYVIGLISFSVIAFITQRIITSILLETNINPMQDFYNINNYILSYLPYYLTVYTIIYFLITYFVFKYDRYIMNKLNKKLQQVKEYEKNIGNGGNKNV